MCGLLANYSKDLSEAETYREKGDVQLKHAKLIIDKVKNCSIPAVVGRSEQLPCDCGVMLKETTIQVFCPKCYKTWKMK